MTKWEYLTVATPTWPDAAMLNRLGSEGWELVMLTLGRAYFKRQLFREF